MGKRFIPVASPVFAGNEKKYVNDCLDTTWISSTGKYLDQFEEKFAEFCQVKHAVACCNGTVAVHLALLAMGVGAGDEVLVPTLTFIATANAVTYCGARPVFVDSEPKTWNIDPAQLEKKITSRTKGIIVVHLYGHPADMDPIMTLARKHGLFVIEDAAEAHGAVYKGRRVGGIGDLATFSFYGNKIITTGEGGMVTTNDDTLAQRVRQLKGQGMDPQRRYWFPIIGYNYRMTNLAAAIGLAQLEKIDWHLARHREIAKWYVEHLQHLPGVHWQPELPEATNVYWMFNAVLDNDCPVDRDVVMKRLLERGVETRPVFHPMHTLPPYIEAARGHDFPVAEQVACHGFSLPTWSGLTKEDVRYVCESLKESLI
jgi:perosamine synthetase